MFRRADLLTVTETAAPLVSRPHRPTKIRMRTSRSRRSAKARGESAPEEKYYKSSCDKEVEGQQKKKHAQSRGAGELNGDCMSTLANTMILRFSRCPNLMQQAQGLCSSCLGVSANTPLIPSDHLPSKLQPKISHASPQ